MPYEVFELDPVGRGADLFGAVEAAQYARMIDHEEPESPAEARALESFVGLFQECSESWEDRSSRDQANALVQLDARIAELRSVGLFVYATILHCRFEEEGEEGPRLPLAVLKITHEGGAPVTAQLPDVVD